jgi:hypothetical protein
LIQLVEQLPPCGSPLHSGLFRLLRGWLRGGICLGFLIRRRLVPDVLYDFHGILLQPLAVMPGSRSLRNGNIVAAVVIDLGILV